MDYFVTGATGFIGRFLIERLLEREGDIHVLVRKGSSAKLEALAEGWGQPERIKPVEGDLSKPALGVSKPWIKAHAGKIDHFFHLAAIYDMTADDEANRDRQRRRHAPRGRARQRAQGRLLPPGLVRRRRGPLRGRLHRGHVRRGPAARPPVPPHEVRVREDRARPRPRCRGASTGRRSSSATRRPARWTRSTARTTSSRR